MRIVVAVFRRRPPPLDVASACTRYKTHARCIPCAHPHARPARARSFRCASSGGDSRRDGRLSERWRIKSQNRPVTTREVNIENTTGFRIRVLKQGDDGRIWFKTRVTTRASERVEDDDVRTGTVRAVYSSCRPRVCFPSVSEDVRDVSTILTRGVVRASPNGAARGGGVGEDASRDVARGRE